jgi:hypothetical protein
VRFAWVSPQARLAANSTIPYGDNDGAVWVGRGLTAAVSGGFAVRSGVLSLTVAPVAFIAQNAEFTLADREKTGPDAFRDPATPEYIDQPQRFGNGAYGRIDPGQTTLRLDWKGFAAGASTANQGWGPAVRYPLVMGNNAAGFAHVFLGTAHPVNVGIGQVHGRVMWGRLSQSDYSPAPDSIAQRLGSGFSVAFVPRGAPGLELGVTRFFHSHWPGRYFGAEDLRRPFQGLLKSHLKSTGEGTDSRSDRANQLASAYARWVFPASGFEVYGEFAREDHSYDVRDLLLEPDHISAYLVGMQRVWTRSDGSLLVLRGEVANARVTQLVRLRPQSPFYIHTDYVQGHTQLGQTLGSPAIHGGAGATVALDRYRRTGRLTFYWIRDLRWDPGPIDLGTAPIPQRLDVLHSLGFETVRFGRRFDVTAGAAGVAEFNRNFRDDIFNVNATLGARLRLGPRAPGARI